MKIGQISLEFIMLFGFVLVILAGIITTSIIYNSEIKDSIRMTQATNFANKLISSTESISYSGPKSRTTFDIYLPEGVENIQVIDNSLVLTVSTSNGVNVIAFPSNANIVLEGEISPIEGIKNIKLINREGQSLSYVEIKQTFEGDEDSATLLDHVSWSQEEEKDPIGPVPFALLNLVKFPMNPINLLILDLTNFIGFANPKIIGKVIYIEENSEEKKNLKTLLLLRPLIIYP